MNTLYYGDNLVILREHNLPIPAPHPLIELAAGQSNPRSDMIQVGEPKPLVLEISIAKPALIS